ncbi:MAG: glyoxalase [Gammaproteobacteria bacterium]|nr:glyoxalase [Gammaproteobacteria bacterium]
MTNYLQIHHTSVLVSDTRRALAFYRDVLEMPLVQRPDLGYPGAWLEVGSQQIHLIELAPTRLESDTTLHGGRDHHVALSVYDLDVLVGRLDSHRVAYARSRSGRRALFCRDPDGNALEFVELAG